MGLLRVSRRTGVVGLSLLAATVGAGVLVTIGGCQMGPTLATKKLAQHQRVAPDDGAGAPVSAPVPAG